MIKGFAGAKKGCLAPDVVINILHWVKVLMPHHSGDDPVTQMLAMPDVLHPKGEGKADIPVLLGNDAKEGKGQRQ